MKIWEQALEILKEEISPVGYKTYVEVMIPRLSDENTVCFLAPSNYHIEVLTKKYLDLISNTLTFLTNKNYIIHSAFFIPFIIKMISIPNKIIFKLWKS